MSLTKYMDKTFKEQSHKSVLAICFPLPPTRVGTLMFMPDSFASKTFDIPEFVYEGFIPIITKPSIYGLAVLGSISLSSLITPCKNGLIQVDHSTCCASVSVRHFFRGEEAMFVSDVVLDKLKLAGRSCHPGSHLIIPEAPYLTALLQWAQSPSGDNYEVEHKDYYKDKGMDITYAHPDYGRTLFPDVSFDRNLEIDEYLMTCSVGDKVSQMNAVGVGLWAKPYLSRLRRNSILLREFYDGKNVEGRGDLLLEPTQENVRNIEVYSNI